jgi:hypothetical protein
MKRVILSVDLPDGYEDFTIKSVSIMKITDEINYKRLPVKIIERPTDEEIKKNGITYVETSVRELAVYCVGYKNCITDIFGS